MNEFIEVIKTTEDFIKLLTKNPGENLFFAHHKFECDIDLYSILEKNPIKGIRLIKDVSKVKRMERTKEVQELSPCFYCVNLIFEKNVLFNNSYFGIHVHFENVTFEQGVNFQLTNFNKEVTFRDVATKAMSFIGFKSKSSVIMSDCRLTLNDRGNCSVEIEKDFLIINTKFNSDVDLLHSTVKGQLIFSDVIFEKGLNISGSKIGQFILNSSFNNETRTEVDSLNMVEAEFFSQIQFTKITFKGIFNSKGAIFHDNLFLDHVDFRGKKNLFIHAVFHKGIDFKNAKVETSLSFYGSTFNNTINFKGLDFSKAILSFAGTHIRSNLWIGMRDIATSFYGKLNFQGATIYAGSVVRLVNLNNRNELEGKVCFKNTLVNGLIDFKHVYLKELDFLGAIVQGNIQDDNTLSSAIKNRSTARILKHEAKKINNMISAISYHKIEMDNFNKELTWTFKDFGEKIILLLNKISNNYGTSWLLGILFTVGTGLIFYTGFILSCNGIGWLWGDDWNFLFNDEDFWAGFINFFWLPTGFEKLSSNGIVYGGFWGAIFFILGKIGIAYGIYQTIAAFRKHIK